MGSSKYLFTILVILVTVFSPYQHCQASAYFTSAGGRGYTEARKAPSTAAAVALTLGAIAAIVAVGLYKQGHAHSH